MAADMMPGEYSTRTSEGSSRPTISTVVDSAPRLDAAGRGTLFAPEPLRSWPGIVHGGALIALLDRAAALLGAAAGPRVIEGRLTSPVPIATPLTLEGRAEHTGVSLIVSHDGHALSSGIVRAGASDGGRAAWTGGADGWTVPMSEDCLACGRLNPIGLRVALRFDDEGVWARFEPPEVWRAPSGYAHPALAPVALDEVAWWLGALVTREGGLTNRLTVTYVTADALFGPVIAAGRFDHVSPIDRRRTFWRTESTLTAADGALLATASIVFRGGPEYSPRQLAYFRQRTPAAVFRRMFPNHVP